MDKKKNSQRLSNVQIAVLFVIASAFGVIVIQYFSRINEGLSHFASAEYQIIAPDYISPESKAKKVPDFTLVDRSQHKVKLSQFDSIDVLVVNVWSSGCPVCREEIPSLTELDRRLTALNESVALLTIAIAPDWEEVAGYFPKGTNLRILFDGDDSVGNGVFQTEKYPETFILDKQRRIRARFDGARNWHGDTFINYVRSFL